MAIKLLQGVQFIDNHDDLLQSANEYKCTRAFSCNTDLFVWSDRMYFTINKNWSNFLINICDVEKSFFKANCMFLVFYLCKRNIMSTVE